MKFPALKNGKALQGYNILNIKINTVAKYLAEQTSEQVNASSGTGFRGYMCEDNLTSIFGYNPVEEGVT